MSVPATTVAALGLVLIVAVVPLAPTEAVLIACGVLAASGHLPLVPVVVVAAFGCSVSDLINYRMGHLLGIRALDRIRRRPGARVVVEWIARQLADRGEFMLVAVRFLPAGGIIGAVIAGGLRWPLRRFVPVSATGSTLWSAYAVLVGYLGGTLTKQPAFAMLISLAVAAALSLPAWLAVRRTQRGAAGDLDAVAAELLAAPLTAAGTGQPPVVDCGGC